MIALSSGIQFRVILPLIYFRVAPTFGSTPHVLAVALTRHIHSLGTCIPIHERVARPLQSSPREAQEAAKALQPVQQNSQVDAQASTMQSLIQEAAR